MEKNLTKNLMCVVIRGGAEIWIEDEADVKRAQRILADYERPAIARASRHCASCGEDSPGGFEICWHCGKPL